MSTKNVYKNSYKKYFCKHGVEKKNVGKYKNLNPIQRHIYSWDGYHYFYWHASKGVGFFISINKHKSSI